MLEHWRPLDNYIRTIRDYKNIYIYLEPQSGYNFSLFTNISLLGFHLKFPAGKIPDLAIFGNGL